MISLQMSEQEVLEEMQAIRKLYALKEVMRYQSIRDMSISSESVAEHLFGMQILAYYFLPLEDPVGKLNTIRVHELILFHEIGEIETGDILFHKKGPELQAVEREAAARVAASLPEPFNRIAIDRFMEFEECATPEARFSGAIDRIEPIFHLYEDRELQLFKKLGINKYTALNSKRRALATYPYMSRFLETWANRAVSLDTFPE